MPAISINQNRALQAIPVAKLVGTFSTRKHKSGAKASCLETSAGMNFSPVDIDAALRNSRDNSREVHSDLPDDLVRAIAGGSASHDIGSSRLVAPIARRFSKQWAFSCRPGGIAAGL